MEKKCIGKKEVCEMLDISSRTIDRWMKDRRIPYHKMPSGTVRFSKAKIEAWLLSREVRPTA